MKQKPGYTIWDDAAIGKLRDLWNTGASTAEIGRRMGYSKNAIVGKAYRLGLDSRPSPILDRSAYPKLRPKLRPKSSTPPLKPRPEPVVKPPRVTLPPLKPRPEPVVETPRVTLPMILWATPEPVKRRAMRCEWLEGKGGPRDWTNCPHPAIPGKSWCVEHAARVFSSVPWRW
jgi:GcrA cell cycle regulator